MKPASHLPSRRGSVLVSVLAFVVVMAAICGSMLEMTSQEFLLSKRTAVWNQAMFSAESGTERAWNELNKLTDSTLSTNGSFMSGWMAGSGMTPTNWTIINQALTPLANSGESNSTYSVNVITNAPPADALSPRGYNTIIASGAMTSPQMDIPVTRNVQVVVKPYTPFSMAMLARGLINFNGNTAVVDSYDSSLGGYSTATRKTNGDVGTNGQLIDADGLDIYGSMYTGPGGVVTTAPGFNQYPVSGDNVVSDGLKVSVPDVKVPSALTALSSSGALGATTLVAPNDVKYSSITLNGNDKLTIRGTGTIRIYVTGNTSVSGSAQMVVSNGVNLVFYSDGNLDLGGNGVVNTGGSTAAGNLTFYGTSTCTSVGISGSTAFAGTIYAPRSTATLNGGAVIYGSLVANTINAVGTIDFHYDEQLANKGSILGYSVTRWKEY